MVGWASRRSGRPSQRSGWVREALPEVCVGLGGPCGGLVGVGRPSRRSRSGQEAHPEVQEGLGSSPKGL